MASKGLDDAVGTRWTRVGLYLRENRIEVDVRCWHMTDDAMRVLRGLGIPEGAVEFEVNLEGRCPGRVSIEYVDLFRLLGFPLFAALVFLGGAVIPAKLRDDLDRETWRPWGGLLW